MKRNDNYNEINNIVKLLNGAFLENISWERASRRIKLSIYCYDNIQGVVEKKNNIKYDHIYLLINAEFVEKIEISIEQIDIKMLIHKITLEMNEANEYSFELKIDSGQSIKIICKGIILDRFTAYNGNEYIDIM